MTAPPPIMPTLPPRCVARLVTAGLAYKAAADSNGEQRRDEMKRAQQALCAAACALPEAEMAVFYEVADEGVQ